MGEESKQDASLKMVAGSDLFGTQSAQKFTISSRKYSNIRVEGMPDDAIVTIMHTN
jgi:hypothetical protein